MKNIPCLIFILFSLSISAQEKQEKITEIQPLDLYNDTLKSICKNLYNSKTDAEKQKWNRQLLGTFERALKTDNSFNFPFDSLNDLARLVSPDNLVRIINWNVPKNDGTQEYFGFIQKKNIIMKKKGIKNETTETFQLYPLIDKSAEIKNSENYIGDNKKWYGMLYYKIIIKESKGQTYYTLLAWDGNDKFSSKKIIDVLTFDNKGTPHFGADIFNTPIGAKKRIVFEFDATCTMSLKYDAKKDSIIFDHLSPPQPQLEGQYQYYCTDFTYDGFGFKHGKWNYGDFVNATNEKDVRDKNYKDPRGVSATSESNIIIKPTTK